MLGSPLESFVLSQFLGLYFLIVGVIMFNRVVAYRQLVQKIDPHSGTLLLGGLIGLLIGMLLVVIHNVWVFNPIVFVTIICWAILIVSILVLSMPERMVMITRKLLLSSGYYWLASFLALLGILFLLRGIYMYVTRDQSFLLFSIFQ